VTGARSILLVCHFYPPSAGAGVQRPLLMAKYLRRLGHSVTILTTSAFGEEPDDGEQQVERSFDLQLVRARLRGLDSATPILEGDTYTNRPHPLSYLLVPEALILSWAPFAVARAIALHRRRRFDCVITTSPPESGHVVGYALQRMGARWIADVRDGWVFESYRPAWPTRLQHRLDRRLERALMCAADAVTCVSEPLADYYRNLGAKAVVVPNGWDPESLPDATPGPHPLVDSNRVSLVHTGRLEVVSRDATPLVEGLQALSRDDPELASRLELVFAGSFTDRERRLFARDVSPGRVVLAGHLSRADSVALQRAADGLILITAGTRRHEVTGKIFEYLGAARPILALAEGTEAGRIVKEARAGIVISAGDAEAARRALTTFGRGEAARPSAQAGYAYSYPQVAERMAEQVADVTRGAAPAVAARAAGR
jgi:glycosyltransferase involved in cell wall biosynthesis